jgi:hypothetical protein
MSESIEKGPEGPFVDKLVVRFHWKVTLVIFISPT